MYDERKGGGRFSEGEDAGRGGEEEARKWGKKKSTGRENLVTVWARDTLGLTGRILSPSTPFSLFLSYSCYYLSVLWMRPTHHTFLYSLRLSPTCPFIFSYDPSIIALFRDRNEYANLLEIPSPRLTDSKLQTTKDKPSYQPGSLSFAPTPILEKRIHSAHMTHTTLLFNDWPLKAHLQPYNHVCITREYGEALRRRDLEV